MNNNDRENDLKESLLRTVGEAVCHELQIPSSLPHADKLVVAAIKRLLKNEALLKKIKREVTDVEI